MSIFSKYPYQNFSDYNLDWCIQVCKEMLSEVESLDKWKTEHTKEYNELKAIVDNIYNGKLSPALENSIRTWLNNNAVSIISEWIKAVYFGLTNAGYFAAYIPASWNEFVEFDTVMDGDNPLYGHLLLRYA